VGIAEIEGHVLTVPLSGYGLNDIWLVGWHEDEGNVVRIQEELRQVLKPAYMC